MSDVEQAFREAEATVEVLRDDHRPQATRAALKAIIDLCRAVYEDTPRAKPAKPEGTEGSSGD
jgi:hypothetical protein